MSQEKTTATQSWGRGGEGSVPGHLEAERNGQEERVALSQYPDEQGEDDLTWEAQ